MINEEKSRSVDLGRGESFGFLGFDFRRVRSRRGVWCAQYTPKLKKRTALLRKLKDVFRRYPSQPLDRVIDHRLGGSPDAPGTQPLRCPALELRLPRCDLIGVHVELLRQLSQCSIALDGSTRNLRLDGVCGVPPSRATPR